MITVKDLHELITDSDHKTFIKYVDCNDVSYLVKAECEVPKEIEDKRVLGIFYITKNKESGDITLRVLVSV